MAKLDAATSLREDLRSKGYYCPAEVAKLVKVNRTTIYRWIRDEKVKAIAFNGNFFVEWDSVSKFMGPIAAVLNLPDKSTGNASI